MTASRTRSRARKGARRSADRRTGDLVQARLLAAIACVFGAGAIILPLPLGLAAMLLAGWGLWRHGRTRFGVLALATVSAATLVGIVAGIAL
jgi:hypothetical protein